MIPRFASLLRFYNILTAVSIRPAGFTVEYMVVEKATAAVRLHRIKTRYRPDGRETICVLVRLEHTVQMLQVRSQHSALSVLQSSLAF